MAARFHQLAHHVYQRGIAALQVGRQQRKDAMVRWWSEGQFEATHQALVIHLQVGHVMAAVDAAGGAAALEYGLGFMVEYAHGVPLEKLHGQKRYLRHGAHRLDTDAQMLHETAIRSVVLHMMAEQLQSQPVERHIVVLAKGEDAVTQSVVRGHGSGVGAEIA